MSDDPDRVAALIRELLNLNKEDSAATAHPQSVEELERRRFTRTKVRQELVLVLSRRNL